MSASLRIALKNILKFFGIESRAIVNWLGTLSIKSAISGNNFGGLIDRLRKIAPDISSQEEGEKEAFNAYWELKRRALQAFQCSLMLKALEGMDHSKLIVVDIGDSAGTHLMYLKELTKDRHEIEGIGVNLDRRAVDKIKARGFRAILCMADELDLGAEKPDLFLSFEMLEHLHNPAGFLYRLAKITSCSKFVLTVPYARNSRVGLHHLRNNTGKNIFAEDEHIFELSPEDWKLLMLHSGWRVVYSKIYYQYPRRWPLVSQLLSLFWKSLDYEGFLGIILEKDTSSADLYQDWPDYNKCVKEG